MEILKDYIITILIVGFYICTGSIASSMELKEKNYFSAMICMFLNNVIINVFIIGLILKYN